MNKELMFNEMLENIKGYQLLEYTNSVKLISNKDNILIVFDVEGKEVIKHLTNIPYTFEGDEIHGNTRNKLAIDFINKYTAEDLQKLNYNFRKNIYDHQQNENNNKYLLEKLFADYDFKKFEKFYKSAFNEIEINYVYMLNGKYIIEFRCSKNKYSSDRIEIYLSENYNNKFTFIVNESQKELTQNEVIEELNTLYKIYNIYYLEVQEQKRIKREQEEKEIKIYNVLRELYKNTVNSIIIIKSGKKSFTAYNSWCKYATGTGKAGKYINCNFSKFHDAIVKKGIDKVQYVLLDKDFITSKMENEDYNNLNWNDIVIE